MLSFIKEWKFINIITEDRSRDKRLKKLLSGLRFSSNAMTLADIKPMAAFLKIVQFAFLKFYA